MATSHFIRRDSTSGSSSGVRSIPPEVVLMGVRRLRLLALVLVGLLVISILITRVPLPGLGRDPWLAKADAGLFLNFF
jgi:hypothetical protein